MKFVKTVVSLMVMCVLLAGVPVCEFNRVARAETVTVIDIPDNALNVKKFGARGDGKTDDTHELLSAIKTAHGEPLYIPSGTYIVNGDLITDSIDVNLIGVGNPVIQLVTTKSNKRCVDFRKAQSVKITGITFDGYRVTYGEKGYLACMSIVDCNNVDINNCRFQNCYNEAICLRSEKDQNVYSMKNISITNNTFYNTSNNVWVRCRVSGLNFSDNTSELSRGSGLEFVSGSISENIVVSNNSFKDIRNGNAVKILDVKDVKITGNRFENCLYGVRVFVSDKLIKDVYSCENVLISNNSFVNGEDKKTCYPIDFVSPTSFESDRCLYDNIEIASNTINTTNGMAVSFVENLYVHDNKINLTGDSVAYIFNSCHNAKLANEAPVLIKDTMCRSNNTKNIYMDNVTYNEGALFNVQSNMLNVYMTNMSAIID